MQPTTVYVQASRACCVRPLLSTVLGVITAAFFLGAFGVAISYDHDCKCEGTGPCCQKAEESGHCDEDNYHCFCVDRDNVYCKRYGIRGGKLAGAIVLLVLGGICLTFAAMTCCCYHKMVRGMEWIPVRAHQAYGVMSVGNPVPSAPPTGGIPMSEVELNKPQTSQHAL